MSKIWLFRLAAWRCTPRKLASGLLVLTALAVFPAQAATFTLLWDDDAANTDTVKYRVYRADGPAEPYTLLKSVTLAKTGVEVPLDQRRCYRIRAVDSLGQVSPMSDFFCFAITTETGP